MIFIKKIYKLLCFNIKPEPEPEPEGAYCRALESGYTRELEEIACKEAYLAYFFARDVAGADIEYCQEHACKGPEDAYWFTCGVPEADLNYCLEACKGTEWYARIQVHIMEEAIR